MSELEKNADEVNIDHVVADEIDVMPAIQKHSDALLRREWMDWEAASGQDLIGFEAALEIQDLLRNNL